MALLPGFRFRKTITILPGVKINLSKSGASTSIGGKGATVNIGHGKQTVNVGIPGTGLSYRAQATKSLILILVAAAVLIGLAYLIAPQYVKPLLHWWQPRWF